MKNINCLIFIFLSIKVFGQPGSIDTTFNPNDIGYGSGDGPNSYVSAVASVSGGKFLVAGWFDAYNRSETYDESSRNRLFRVHANGQLDYSFDAQLINDGVFVSTPKNRTG